MPKTSSKKGFTLIELTLALVFVSFLLLTIAFLVLHISGIYQKGIAIKDITATGRELIDEFSHSISISSSRLATEYCSSHYAAGTSNRSRCDSNHARDFIYQQRTAHVLVKDVDTEVPINGLFCTGSYTYIWNTGYALNPEEYPAVNNSTLAVSLVTTNETYSNFRLLKVMDPDRQLCQSYMEDGSYGYKAEVAQYEYDFPFAAEEILDDSENNLVLYDLTIFRPTQHEVTFQTFYSGTFILGTLRGNIDITGNGDYCATQNIEDGDYGQLFNYCALNKFNFAMRAAGQQI